MMFHPFEIGFSGYSNTGKTILITRLIEKFKKTYKIGYVKHASCGFSLDTSGKDSDLVYKSGASEIHLIDEHHSATISQNKTPSPFEKLNLSTNDIVFIEGFKDLSHEKIVFLDPQKEILKRAKNVIATVGEGGDFKRDDLNGIASFIESYFFEKVKKQPLYGLVLAGGFSKRMGKDKALLCYHKKTQAEIGFKLLSSFCDKVFLSRRKDQKKIDLPLLYDEFLNMGPLGGILTAMKTHPEAAWLILACDLPFMDTITLDNLLQKRNPFKFATAYPSDDGLPEPLCTIYEPKSYSLLLKCLGLGYMCPRKALMHFPIHLITPVSKQSLCNVNAPLSYAP